MEQQQSITKNVMKRGVCERNIHRSIFAIHLRPDGYSLKTSESRKCDFSTLFVEATDFENFLLSDSPSMN